MKYQRNCEVCGVAFETDYFCKVMCSADCRHKRRLQIQKKWREKVKK
jgi:predicted nucleic acid-binding Zn ribbon protein